MGAAVGIVCISVGRYSVFWPAFFASVERHFLPGTPKRYVVFSDAPQGQIAGPGVTVVPVKKDSWPGPTLKRFEMIRDNAALFDGCSHVYFMNGNIDFLQDVTPADVAPGPNGMLCALHWAKLTTADARAAYETTQTRSLAYIGPTEGPGRYVMGGFLGGRTDAFLAMSTELAHNIQTDLAQGLVAKWHDESHLNRYIIGKDVRLLPRTFAIPEDLRQRTPPMAVFLDKRRFGGHAYLRGESAEPRNTPLLAWKCRLIRTYWMVRIAATR